MTEPQIWSIIASIIASVLSILLGSFTIWLSMTFFKMVSNTSGSICNAANQVERLVSQITRSGKLYATNGTNGEDFKNAQHYAWHGSTAPRPLSQTDIDKSATRVFDATIVAWLKDRLPIALADMAIGDAQTCSLQDSIQDILHKALIEAENASKRERNSIINQMIISEIISLKSIKSRVSAGTLVDIMRNAYFILDNESVNALFELRKEGTIMWSEDCLLADSELYIPAKK